MNRNRKVIISVIVATLITCGSYILINKKGFVSATEYQTGITEQLNQYLNNEPNLKGAIIGVSIRSATTGEILYDHLGDVRLRPASNMKLLTAAAALSVLGKDHSFQTEVHTDGTLKDNSLKGNLYLKGMGDPTLVKSDFDKMAKQLQQTGMRRIDGNLIGDDSWYDNVRYSIDLPWSDEQAYYGSQISALTASPDEDYDAGTVIIEISPGQDIGDQAMVTLVPKTGVVDLVNKTMTVSPEETRDITIERKHGTNTIILKGTVPISSNEVRDWIALWEPTNYAIDLFKQSLAAHGIQVTGQIKQGITPKTTSRLISHQSITLSELLIPFMKLSNNGHAETLVKEMGKVVTGIGSWKTGLEVLEGELDKFTVNTETIFLRDGSGMSHVTLIPANEISNLLYHIQNENWFPDYLNSLPVAGVSERMVGGSLRYRMVNSLAKEKARAKTGTLTTVSSLSGYIEPKSGENLIFSVIINNIRDESKAKEIEDKICGILANY